MNCKKDDLAIVINAEEERYIGTIVTCLELLRIDPLFGPIWRVDKTFTVTRSFSSKITTNKICDECLRPISRPGISDDIPTDNPIKIRIPTLEDLKA